MVRSIMSLIGVALLTLTACKTMKYENLADNPASPQDKVLVFSLRNSDIKVAPLSQKPDATTPIDVCKTTTESTSGQSNAGHGEMSTRVPKAGEAEHPQINIEKVVSQLPSDPVNQCLNKSKVSVSAVPVREGDQVFSGKPKWGTTITASAVDIDPLMIKSLTVNYKNPAAGAVTSIGGAAAVGCGIAGPWGCAVGAGVGVLGYAAEQVMQARNLARAGEPTKLDDKVCAIDFANQAQRAALETLIGEKSKSITEAQAELEKEQGKQLTDIKAKILDELNKIPPDAKPVLLLPVVLEYRNNPTQCWHLFPSTDQGEPGKPVPVTGWLYRFYPAADKILPKSKIPPVINPKPKMTAMIEGQEQQFIADPKTGIIADEPITPDRKDIVRRDVYFAKLQQTDGSVGEDTFPVSACRAIEVQITHVTNLKADEAARFPMLVADSQYLQPIYIPTNGVVSLFQVCGGFSSPMLSLPPSSETFDAIVKQTQQVKDAQSKYSTAKQSTKK